MFFGRDKKKKVSGTGSLIVTNKAIYFAGRDYPFDRIGSIIKKGNSIFVEVDVSKNSAYGSGWTDVIKTGIGGESLSVELEIQTNDVGNVSNALEEARLPNEACEYCHTVYSKALDICSALRIQKEDTHPTIPRIKSQAKGRQIVIVSLAFLFPISRFNDFSFTHLSTALKLLFTDLFLRHLHHKRQPQVRAMKKKLE